MEETAQFFSPLNYHKAAQTLAACKPLVERLDLAHLNHAERRALSGYRQIVKHFTSRELMVLFRAARLSSSERERLNRLINSLPD